MGIGKTNPQAKLDVNGEIHSSSNLYVDRDIEATNVTATGAVFGSGPRFISPILVAEGTAATTGSPVFDLSDRIPYEATAVILEAEAAMGAPDSGDIDAHIKIGTISSSSSYVLLRGRSAASGDNVAWAAQGIFPVGHDDRRFTYTVEAPGFDRGWTIRLIGYFY